MQEKEGKTTTNSQKTGFGLRLILAIIFALATIVLILYGLIWDFDIFWLGLPFLILAVLQFVATFMGKTTAWANIISIVLGSLFLLLAITAIIWIICDVIMFTDVYYDNNTLILFMAFTYIVCTLSLFAIPVEIKTIKGINDKSAKRSFILRILLACFAFATAITSFFTLPSIWPDIELEDLIKTLLPILSITLPTFYFVMAALQVAIIFISKYKKPLKLLNVASLAISFVIVIICIASYICCFSTITYIPMFVHFIFFAGIFGLFGGLNPITVKYSPIWKQKRIEKRTHKEKLRIEKRMRKEELRRKQNEELKDKSHFDGSAIIYYLMGVAVFFGTLFTLGIAYPFLRCWRLKWEKTHTYIDGKQLVFDGNGAQLMGTYIIWLLLSVVTMGIYLALIMPLNMIRWETKHTHFKDEQGESHWDGHIWQLFGVKMLSRFVTLITLGIASFWAKCYKERWLAKHTVLDDVRLSFDGTGMQYFAKKIIWLLLTVATIGIYGLFLKTKVKSWIVSHTHRVIENPTGPSESQQPQLQESQESAQKAQIPEQAAPQATAQEESK